MPVPKKPKALDWQALALAGLHETKVSILCHLAETGNEATSPGALAELLGQPLGQVSYHVRQLADPDLFGLIELVRTEPRRGALQHFYKLTPVAYLSGRQLARLRLREGANGPAESADESLARRFHEAYERLAPTFGYKTRDASAVPWVDVPVANKNLMRAVCRELLEDVGT